MCQYIMLAEGMQEKHWDNSSLVASCVIVAWVGSHHGVFFPFDAGTFRS